MLAVSPFDPHALPKNSGPDRLLSGGSKRNV